jgi:uncharacterized membrane protein HdeD (DUF308 family)
MSRSSKELKRMEPGGKRLVMWGVVVIVFGTLAILAPFLTGVAVSLLVGALLVAAGIVRLVWAFKAGSFGRGLLAFLLGGVSLACGAIMLAQPLLGLASLTLVLAAYFFADGVFEIGASFAAKPAKGWGWLLFGGLVSLLLGILLLREWPFTGIWAVGTLVGIRLLFVGWGMIGLATIAPPRFGTTASVR